MKSFLPSVSALTATISLGVIAHRAPTGPPLNFLLGANITSAAPIIVGPEPGGTRAGLPVAGGAFAGPCLNGTILPVGVDAGILTPSGGYDPDGIAIWQTADGAHIIYRNKGYQVDGSVYGATTFETGHPKYSWLNTRVFMSSAKLSPSGSVALDICHSPGFVQGLMQ